MGCFIACFGSSKHRKSKKPTTTCRNQNLFRRPVKFEPAQHTNPAEAAKFQDSIKPFWDSKRSTTDSITKSLDQNLFKRPENDNTKPTEASKIQDSIKPIPESREIDEAQLNGSTEKKVIFDLNVETNKKGETQEDGNCAVESEENEREKGTTGNEEVEIEKEKEKEKGAKEENRNRSQTFSDSSNSSMISYPPMHRYHGCTSSDEEYPDMSFCNIDSNSDVNLLIQEESSESLFSLSIESRKQVNRAGVDDKEVTSPLKTCCSSEKEMNSIDSNKQISRAEVDIKEVNSPLKIIDSPEKEMKSIRLDPNPRDRSPHVRSVLNPVENISQWTVVKARTTTPLSYEEKENANLEQELNIPVSEEPSFKRSGHSSKLRASFMKREDEDIVVDTSLSSWLAESEKTPVNKGSPSSVGYPSLERVNSWRSFEDRPILGALTVEEVKQLSASSSPRRSPSRNPDEMPIIGTVGSYWSHTGQTMDSSNSGSSRKRRSGRSRKLSEDKTAVRRHATPFGTRLERASDRGTA